MNHKLLLCLFVILGLLVIMPLAFAAQVGLVLYMPFNGDIKDASGNKVQTEVKGKAAWVDGKFGKAMEFDGTTHIEIPDTTKGIFDGTPGLTIGIWVKQDTHHDNGIVVKLITGAAWPCSYNLETWSDQLAYFDVGPDAGKYATAKYPLKEWYYLVGMFDGSKGEDRIYVNGVLGSANPRVEKVVPEGDQPVLVGRVTPGSYPFKGDLDELVIYNRVLTDAEIKENMNGINMAVDKAGKLATTWSAIKSSD
ncbi:MAG: LamG domain-containing protein [Candidatus Poribacteria bacterium]